MKRCKVSMCEVSLALAAAINPDGGTVSTALQMKLARTEVTMTEGDSREGKDDVKMDLRVHSMRQYSRPNFDRDAWKRGVSFVLFLLLLKYFSIGSDVTGLTS